MLYVFFKLFLFLFFVLYSLQGSCQISCLPHPSGTVILGTRNFPPMFLIPSGGSCKLCMSLPLIRSSFGEV